MTRNNNIILTIAEGIILCVIAYFYKAAGFAFLALASNVIIGSTAYRKHYLSLVLECSLVFSLLVFASMQNMYIDLLSLLADFLNLLSAGVVSGIMLKHKKGFYTTVFSASFASLAVMLLTFAVMLRDGKDIFDMYIGDIINAYGEALARSLAQSGVYSKQVLDNVSQIFDMLYTTFKMFMPSVVIISTVVSAFFQFILVKKAIEFAEKQKLCITAFSNIRLNRKTAYAPIIVILLLTVLKKSLFADALYNILVILLFADFVCGVSVIDFFFKRTRLWWGIRFLIYIIALTLASFLAAFLLPGLVILGLLDSRLDLRHLEAAEFKVNIYDDPDDKEDGKK